MIRLFSHYFPLNTLMLIGLDAVCLFAAVMSGCLLLYPGPEGITPLHLVPGALAIALAMLVLSGTLGLYSSGTREEFWSRASRFAITFLVCLPLLHWLFYRLPDGHPAIEALAATMLFGIIGKIAILSFSRVSSSFQRRVLILGVGRDAAVVKDTLDKSHIGGLQIVGFYSLDREHPVDPGVPSHKVFASTRSIGDTARQHNVNEIIIAMRERRGGALPLTDLLNCKLQGITVTDLSAFFEQYSSKVRIDLLRESWFIFGEGFRQHRARMIVKRTFDIIASCILLVVSLPVMLLAAIAIKLESPGPVIYRQERMGLGGRPFDVLKFRSMRADAERDGKPQWAQAGDSRVTRVGKFMRLVRIDELPQLVNVLAGQMSLVGPRPERPFFVDQLVQQVPFYGARHSVKPGVTGWAQVRHHYGASVDDASDKLQYDLFYVKNHTLLFDIMILFYSVRVVLTAQGSR